jgi:hypothetical protein
MRNHLPNDSISEEDYERLCYVRKSGDYPAKGTEAWTQWVALTKRVDRAHFRTRNERSAWHEAGHALVGHRLGGDVNKIYRGDGYLAATHIPDMIYPAFPYETLDTVMVAGHVAEEMTFAQVDPSCDEASRIAWRFRKVRARDYGETVTPQDCRAYVEAAEARARAILEAPGSVLEAIARRVLAGLPVNRDELLGLLVGVPNGDPI